jgi:arylsulfatase
VNAPDLRLRANDSRRAFFRYFAHTAMHGQLGAKREDVERFHARYDAGWDEIPRIRNARQIELGIIGPNVRLPPRNAEPGFDVHA